MQRAVLHVVGKALTLRLALALRLTWIQLSLTLAIAPAHAPSRRVGRGWWRWTVVHVVGVVQCGRRCCLGVGPWEALDALDDRAGRQARLGILIPALVDGVTQGGQQLKGEGHSEWGSLSGATPTCSSMAHLSNAV